MADLSNVLYGRYYLLGQQATHKERVAGGLNPYPTNLYGTDLVNNASSIIEKINSKIDYSSILKSLEEDINRAEELEEQQVKSLNLTVEDFCKRYNYIYYSGKKDPQERQKVFDDLESFIKKSFIENRKLPTKINYTYEDDKNKILKNYDLPEILRKEWQNSTDNSYTSTQKGIVGEAIATLVGRQFMNSLGDSRQVYVVGREKNSRSKYQKTDIRIGKVGISVKNYQDFKKVTSSKSSEIALQGTYSPSSYLNKINYFKMFNPIEIDNFLTLWMNAHYAYRLTDTKNSSDNLTEISFGRNNYTKIEKILNDISNAYAFFFMADGDYKDIFGDKIKNILYDKKTTAGYPSSFIFLTGIGLVPFSLILQKILTTLKTKIPTNEKYNAQDTFIKIDWNREYYGIGQVDYLTTQNLKNNKKNIYIGANKIRYSVSPEQAPLKNIQGRYNIYEKNYKINIKLQIRTNILRDMALESLKF